MRLLVAKTKEGKLISLAAGTRSREEWLIMKAREHFFCPGCKARVYMKLGCKRSWHFAHANDAACPCESEPESDYHVKGKTLLYKWLRVQKLSPFLEPYLPALKQRPDLLIQTPKEYSAIEYQCSTVHQDLFLKRTKAFIKAKITPIWILGGTRLKRLGTSTFQLSDMDWLAVRDFPDAPKSPALLYFCPEAKQFAVLSGLTPISASKVQAHICYFSPETLTLHQLFEPLEPKRSNDIQEWLTVKKRWRLNAFRYRTASYQHVALMLADQHRSLSQFPSLAGLPTPYLFWIETPCFLWQTWLLCRFMLGQPRGTAVSFRDVYDAFKINVSNNTFQVRRMPLADNSHWSFAIMCYLNELTELGYLKPVGKSVFKIIKNVALPESMEQLLDEDREHLLPVD